MTNSYNYTNKTKGPTVHYVSVESHYSKAVCEVVRTMNLGSGSPETFCAAYDKVLTQMNL